MHEAHTLTSSNDRRARRKLHAKTGDIPAALLAASNGVEQVAELELEGLAVTVDETTTTIINEFVGSMQQNNIRATSMPLYTPMGRAVHVLDLPHYDITTRNWELLVDKVALYDHEEYDGRVSRVWRLEAVNRSDPEAEPVQLFEPHRTVMDDGKGYRCVKLAYPCGGGLGVACARCIKNGWGDECNRSFHLLHNVGHAFLTDQACSETEREKIIALGQIKVDVMNRVPLPLEADIDSWSKQVGVHHGSCSHLRKFVDTVSLFTWKEKCHPTIDLSSITIHTRSSTASIWSQSAYSCLKFQYNARDHFATGTAWWGA